MAMSSPLNCEVFGCPVRLIDVIYNNIIYLRNLVVQESGRAYASAIRYRKLLAMAISSQTLDSGSSALWQ